jgi:PhnB protein
MKKVSSVPKGFNTITPYLIVDGVDKFIEFVKTAFGGEATFVHRDEQNENRVMHATVKIGDSIIMLGDTMPGMETQNAMLYLYVDDTDKLFNQAVKAKAKVVRELKDEFYGDRAGAVKDSWGNTWWIATHVEDVGKDELERRSKEFAKQQSEEMAH